ARSGRQRESALQEEGSVVWLKAPVCSWRCMLPQQLSPKSALASGFRIMLGTVLESNRRALAKVRTSFWAVVVVLAVTFVFAAAAGVNATTVGFAYLIAIFLIAASWGLTESIAASVTATACFNYFFLPPIRTWRIAE